MLKSRVFIVLSFILLDLSRFQQGKYASQCGGNWGDRSGLNAVDLVNRDSRISHYTRFGQYSADRNTICRDIAPVRLLSSGMTVKTEWDAVIFAKQDVRVLDNAEV